MKIRTAICVLTVTASAAYAQLNPGATIQNVRSKMQGVSKTAEARSNEALAAAGAQGQPKASGNRSHAVTRSKVAKQRKAKETAAKSEPVAKPSNAPEDEGAQTISTTSHVIRGKRDPFVSVIRSAAGESGCSNGKQCLAVKDIFLQGIVRSPNEIIAVVQNGAGKTYFLHENDPIFNGKILKIRPDSIVIRETVIDRAGRQSAREIVKHVESSPSQQG